MVRVLSSRQGHARSDVERAVMLSRAEERQASEQESVESCKVLQGPAWVLQKCNTYRCSSEALFHVEKDKFQGLVGIVWAILK